MVQAILKKPQRTSLFKTLSASCLGYIPVHLSIFLLHEYCGSEMCGAVT
jgi:hypothetical protein